MSQSAQLLAAVVVTRIRWCLSVAGDRGGSARQWTPLLQETYYVVNMTDMLVDGGSIGVPSHIYNDGETIVDSGTTDLSIPHSAYGSCLGVLCSSFGGEGSIFSK